jgi:hypothetical protein
MHPDHRSDTAAMGHRRPLLGSRYQWAPSTSDVRALESPEKTVREAAAYYDPKQVRVSLKFTKAFTGNVHLYALDWDTTSRRETVSVGAQTAELSASFKRGRLGDVSDIGGRRRNRPDRHLTHGGRERRAVGHLPGMSGASTPHNCQR